LLLGVLTSESGIVGPSYRDATCRHIAICQNRSGGEENGVIETGKIVQSGERTLTPIKELLSLRSSFEKRLKLIRKIVSAGLWIFAITDY
jgi:hypothetical protein